MIEDFARVLHERLVEDLNSERDAVSRGASRDFADYKYVCGVIRGLELADEHLRDLLNLARHADDL